MELKRHLYHGIRRIQRVKTWQLLIILLLSGFLTATFLRLNNIGMAQRYESVLTADKAGKDGDTASRLYDLQRYASAHMNASVEKFDLKYQYERDVQKIIEAATDDGNPNGNINVKAEAVCHPQFPAKTPGYVQCFLDELAKYPAAPNPADKVTFPSPALYSHSFVSPVWSPDFAGFSLLLFLFIATVIVVRFTRIGLLYILLKLRYKGIGS